MTLKGKACPVGLWNEDNIVAKKIGILYPNAVNQAEIQWNKCLIRNS